MKTNVTMIRRMGQFEISQRTADGYFNASTLLEQWNRSSNQQKRVDHFLNLESTKEFIPILETDMRNHADSCVLVSYIIKKGNKSAGESNQVWMHPYLFIDFAMWINPKFKLEVIRFVYDQLIELRHSAGDNYRGLTSAVARFDGVNFAQLAKGLNYIVFGKHTEGLRQTATQDQLKQLTELQKQLAFAIDMGYIRSFGELINEMRRVWNMKHKLCLI